MNSGKRRKTLQGRHIKVLPALIVEYGFSDDYPMLSIAHGLSKRPVSGLDLPGGRAVVLRGIARVGGGPDAFAAGRVPAGLGEDVGECLARLLRGLRDREQALGRTRPVYVEPPSGGG